MALINIFGTLTIGGVSREIVSMASAPTTMVAHHIVAGEDVERPIVSIIAHRAVQGIGTSEALTLGAIEANGAELEICSESETFQGYRFRETPASVNMASQMAMSIDGPVEMTGSLVSGHRGRRYPRKDGLGTERVN